MPVNNGSRNAPTPKNCSRRSEAKAPTIPIQLRAACDPVSTEALLKEGSSGEYEASARKRRSAETPNKNPTSSLSRRLLVGLKTRDRSFIGASPHHRGKPHPGHDARSMPELNDYAKNPGPRQCAIRASIELVLRGERRAKPARSARPCGEGHPSASFRAGSRPSSRTAEQKDRHWFSALSAT